MITDMNAGHSWYGRNPLGRAGATPPAFINLVPMRCVGFLRCSSLRCLLHVLASGKGRGAPKR